MHDPEITAKEAAKVFSCEVSHQSCREVEYDLDSGSITRFKHETDDYGPQLCGQHSGFT